MQRADEMTSLAAALVVVAVGVAAAASDCLHWARTLSGLANPIKSAATAAAEPKKFTAALRPGDN